MAQTTRMTMTRALASLKTLDAKIEAGFRNMPPPQHLSQTQRPSGFPTKEMLIQEMVSQKQALNDQINYRARLRAAIVLSNATTMISVIPNEDPITVAAAIETKNRLPVYIDLYRRLLTQFRTAHARCDLANEQLKDAIEASASKMFTDKPTAKQVVDFVQERFAAQQYTVCAPEGFEDMLRKEAEELQELYETIDFMLSELNAQTIIEF